MKIGKTSRILQIVNLLHYKWLQVLLNVKPDMKHPCRRAETAGSVKNGESAVPVTARAGDTSWTV